MLSANVVDRLDGKSWPTEAKPTNMTIAYRDNLTTTANMESYVLIKEIPD